MEPIILIDDDADFAKSFANEAFANGGLTVAYHRSLDGLKTLLPAKAHQFAAVVLDIKGLLKDNQPKEGPEFIPAALKYLDTHIPTFPRFILTGDESVFENLRALYTDEQLFVKKPDDLKKLWVKLQYCVQQAVPLRIRREHPKVFEVFDRKLLPAAQETKVIGILKGLTEKDPANFKGIIADIREVFEELYKAIHQRNKAVIPGAFMNPNGTPAFGWRLAAHLAGNPDRSHKPTTPVYQDTTLAAQAQLVQHACSEYLHNSSKIGYAIHDYTLYALINALAELLIWSTLY